MSSYIHFTEEQKEQARQTDLCDLLQRQGEKLKRSGREYEWRDGSQKVTIRGNLWFHQYERVGGDAIDFVRKYMNKSYPEAMEYLQSAAEKGNPYAKQLLHSIKNNKNWSATMGSIRLLHHLARMLQNRLEDERKDKMGGIDRKLKRKIDEKKQAHGLKQ